MSLSFCSHCGLPIASGSRFCESCGKPVQTTAATVPTGPAPLTAAAGPSVGPYRLMKELGRGGMGVVYLAVRDDGTFRKNVALKVVLRDRVTAEFVQRFKQERQMLAALDHPNIARILDGGDMPDGTPYYVMEYVEGLPIDKFCDSQRLSLTARIKLFQEVCRAVDYLHRNLVIHRDLKPSNIQVSDAGMVKLLDFGIAKLVGAAAYSAPDLTMMGGSPMTPSFASPEQLAGTTLHGPSDIYSLGVIFYSLLTGRAPYQGMEEKMANIASQRPPPPPSTNLREDLQSTDSTAQLRQALLGELDGIVLKTLSIDPGKRYQSAGDLDRDLQQFLDGQLVTARQPGAALGPAKPIKRTGLVLAAAAVLLAMAGFGFWQWQRAGIVRNEVAEREFKLRALLDQLEGGLAPAVAARQTPDDHIANLKKLRQALQTDFAPLAARQPGVSPERDAILARGVKYLDRLHELNKTDTRVSLEIADTYHQVAAVQEHTMVKGAQTNTIVIDTYRKAVVILVGLDAGSPEFAAAKNRLEALNIRIEALGGARLPAAAVAPDADASPSTPVPSAPTPAAAIVRAAPAPAKPSEPAPSQVDPMPAGQAEKAEVEEKLIGVESKVQIAQQAIDNIKRSLESSGQLLNADTSAAAQRMQSSLQMARRQFSAGNYSAAKESLAAADAFAARALRAVGR